MTERKQAKAKRTAADWASLPPELLQLTARKLTTIWDFACFRRVCASWRLAAEHTDLAPQPPLLVTRRRNNDDYISFFSSFDRRYLHAKRLPESREKFVYGSPHGWLLMIGRPSSNLFSSPRSVTLLNPITGAQILLPHLTVGLNLRELKKAVLCSHPVSGGPGKLLAAVLSYQRLAFLRQGDDSWTLVKHMPLIFNDIVYYNEELYLVDNRGRLAVLRLDSSKVSLLIHKNPLENPEFKPRRAVEAAGDLLLLSTGLHKHMGKTFLYLDLHKLTRGPSKELKWFKIDLEQISEITGVNSRTYLNFTICARGLPNYIGYRIYLFYELIHESQTTYHVQEIDVVLGNGIKVQRNYDPQIAFSQKILPIVSWMVPALQ